MFNLCAFLSSRIREYTYVIEYRLDNGTSHVEEYTTRTKPEDFNLNDFIGQSILYTDSEGFKMRTHCTGIKITQK